MCEAYLVEVKILITTKPQREICAIKSRKTCKIVNPLPVLKTSSNYNSALVGWRQHWRDSQKSSTLKIALPSAAKESQYTKTNHLLLQNTNTSCCSLKKLLEKDSGTPMKLKLHKVQYFRVVKKCRN